MSGWGSGGLLGGVVGVLDGLVNPAAVGDLVPVLLRPGPDLRRLRITTGGGPGPGGPGGLGLGPSASGGVGAQGLPQLLRVSGGEVDLVLPAVQSELDGLLCGTALEVVFQNDFYALRQLSTFSLISS